MRGNKGLSENRLAMGIEGHMGRSRSTQELGLIGISNIVKHSPAMMDMLGPT